ncbi:hypothetical protein [Streptomyces kaempferi]|uniref:Uncharacterized protein n=1 Tax=Streptomyces kaempferi TaxID=333725 RepID=A0ABW3XTG0_9ACTN
MSLKVTQAHRHFRNTLVHYRPERGVLDHLTLDASLFGLVEAYFGEDFASFTVERNHVSYVAQQMEGWSRW